MVDHYNTEFDTNLFQLVHKFTLTKKWDLFGMKCSVFFKHSMDIIV